VLTWFVLFLELRTGLIPGNRIRRQLCRARPDTLTYLSTFGYFVFISFAFRSVCFEVSKLGENRESSLTLAFTYNMRCITSSAKEGQTVDTPFSPQLRDLTGCSP